MTQAFIETVEHYRKKALTVGVSYPEPYLKALRDLIDQLLDMGASIDEARTAMQQLHSDYGANYDA